MARWVVDSTILIDQVRGRAEAHDAIGERLALGDELWSVTVVRTEIIEGARPEDLGDVVRTLARLRWLDVDQDVADLAGRMARHYRRA